jgi:hypothetical protein
MSDRLRFPEDVPFTLVCSDCDVDGPGSYDEALAAGWQRVAYDPELPSSYFVGVCPDCVRDGSRNAKVPDEFLDP